MTEPNGTGNTATVHPSEPVFELRGDDPLAAGLVQLWAFLKAKDFEAAIARFARLCETLPGEHKPGAIDDALKTSAAMHLWRHGNRERRCRGCGCTEYRPCMTVVGPCHWVEPDLCSNCADTTRLETAIAGAAGELGGSGVPGDA